MTKFVALKGKKRSGKDTLADFLIKNHGFVRVYYAEPLKRMLAELFRCAGISEDRIQRMIDGDLKEVPSQVLGGATPRYAMQTLGTEWRNMIDPRLWINIANAKISTLRVAGSNVVLTDLRFMHEAADLESQGFTIVEIRRPEASTGLFEDHASEKEMDSIAPHYLINNDRSLDDLANSGAILMRALEIEEHDNGES